MGLVTVPEELANTDNSGSKKSKLGHGYYNFALLKETSDWALYGPIQEALASERCIYKNEIAAIEEDMALVNAQAQAKQMEEMRLKAEAEKNERKRKRSKMLRNPVRTKKGT